MVGHVPFLFVNTQAYEHSTKTKMKNKVVHINTQGVRSSYIVCKLHVTTPVNINF